MILGVHLDIHLQKWTIVCTHVDVWFFSNTLTPSSNSLCSQNKKLHLHKTTVKKREKQGLGTRKGMMEADIAIK